MYQVHDLSFVIKVLLSALDGLTSLALFFCLP